MSRTRRIMLTILSFIGSTVVGYLVVLIGFMTIWEISGQPDQNGGVAMAVAFFIAPIGGLIIGIACALWAARTLSRKS